MQLRLGARAVEVNVTKHATESESKVLSAALNVFPPDLRNNIVWERSAVQGHYGNPIVFYRAVVEGEQAEMTAKYILSSLDKTSLRYLLSTLESRIDKQGNLYLRLHKQYLVDGRIIAWDGDDVVKVIIKIGRKQEELENLLRKTLTDAEPE